MRVRWFGQAAFLLEGDEHTVMIDPFGRPPESVRSRGIRFGYPPVEGVQADLVLVTHEHFDHNGTDGVDGEPPIVRLAGTHETPIGTVTGVASEHDQAAGTQRGPNAMYRFTLDGVEIGHLGDLGQAALRPEQAEALRGVQLLFVPVGGGPTLDGPQAARVVDELGPRVVVPMHYGTPAADFLGPVEPFLEAVGAEVRQAGGEQTTLDGLPETPTVLVFEPPGSDGS
jgi:L-ascorbate metabolism protein UlaG (beta-lactamase superfamily)